MAERRPIDALDAAVDEILAQAGEASFAAEPELLPLLEVAGRLRELPRESFRTRLAADLAGRAEGMRLGVRGLTPRLVVRGAAAFIEFARRAFGAEPVSRLDRPDGTIAHAEVRVGDSPIHVSDGAETRPAAIHLYVPESDAVYASAVASGATTLVGPTDMPYGDREADVRDPFGNNWYIGTRRQGGPVPAGMRTVTPTLHAEGTDRLIDFIKRVFGALELDRTLSPQGAVLHAQLKLGDSMLELGEAGGFVAPMPCSIRCDVEDVDAAYASALRAGARSLSVPAGSPEGGRAAEFADPFGNHWLVAGPLEPARRR